MEKGYEICVDLWGPMACFSALGLKAERYSTDVPTPSAIRGCLSAIYCKPEEFWWRVRRIEVMSPIRRIAVMLNEVTARGDMKPFDPNGCRAQRNTSYLKDVRYRVTAEIVPHDGFDGAQLLKQAERRIRKGQCFMQPYLGTRECTCYFAPADMSVAPEGGDRDMNIMQYDTHVPYATEHDSPFVLSLYRCMMHGGVIEVPDYDGPEVFRMGGGTLC